MQLNKRGKSPKQSRRSFTDNDFASGFEDSKFDKFKPAIKVFIVIILLATIAWGAAAYFGVTDTESDTNKTHTPPSSSQEYVESPETPQDTAEADTMGPDGSSHDAVSPGDNTSRTNSSSGGNSSATIKPYNPSKCEPLNHEATLLRQAADQKKTTFDSAFAARKNYGYFYDKYGNNTDTQQAYDNQEAQLDLLQADWEDALEKGNAAYSKYQECRAKL